MQPLIAINYNFSNVRKKSWKCQHVCLVLHRRLIVRLVGPLPRHAALSNSEATDNVAEDEEVLDASKSVEDAAVEFVGGGGFAAPAVLTDFRSKLEAC